MKKLYFFSLLFFLLVLYKPVSSQTINPSDTDTTGLTPYLDWPDIPGAAYYQLQISTHPSFAIVILNVTGLTQSNYQVLPGLLLCNTLYFWRYRDYIGGVPGPWSMIFMFTTNCPTGLEQHSNKIPESYFLYQNYPNPFNPSTCICFDVAQYDNVKISVYDVSGNEIVTLVNQELTPGNYEINFDGSNFASSIYFYRMTAGDYTSIKKMVLVK